MDKVWQILGRANNLLIRRPLFSHLLGPRSQLSAFQSCNGQLYHQRCQLTTQELTSVVIFVLKWRASNAVPEQRAYNLEVVGEFKDSAFNFAVTWSFEGRLTEMTSWCSIFSVPIEITDFQAVNETFTNSEFDVHCCASGYPRPTLTTTPMSGDTQHFNSLRMYLSQAAERCWQHSHHTADVM